MATTRSRFRQVDQVDDPPRPLHYQDERCRCIKVQQDEDPELKRLKDYLRGDPANYTRKEVKKITKGSDRYVLYSRDVLYRLVTPTQEQPRDNRSELRLVVPEALRLDILHHDHEDFQSGHQSITRTYESLWSEFFWTGMFPVNVRIALPPRGDLQIQPENIEPTGPFEVVSMDFVTHTHLPKTERGNTFLLLFQEMFTGFVMWKPMSSTTAQDCEDVVFRNYGASSENRHDRDPRFKSRVYRRFSEMMSIQHKATLAYHLQANGQQDRSGQTIMHSIRAYVQEPDQTDRDDNAEKIMHAMNMW
ncbi:reverse transcriptase [Phytophthora megakarya]|uniref:Reverse transcriptase n=1 Tax=Phytophthora megakarya TaxID=4795 RepID=A0A225VK51_9STRA|nr:reverse transcriptase [Phytophthora megakarya]